MQDSPTDPVSVNYCQLSSPGYKEEELRRGDTEALGGRGGSMEEFTIQDLTCSSCRGHYQYVNQIHDVDSLTLTPNTTAHFSVVDRYLVAKTPGFYGISVSGQIQVYQALVHLYLSPLGSAMILNTISPLSSPKPAVVRLDTGDKLSMKTSYQYMSSAKGSKLFIALLN